MAEFVALPLFTDSWLADTGHLSRAERGLYLDLLVLMWRSPECRVPNDMVWVERKLRCSEDERETLAGLVKEFCSSTGNFLTQKRLRKEFEYIRAKHKKQSASAKSRWQKEKENTNAHADDMPQHETRHASGNAPSPSPSPSPSTPPYGGVGATPPPFVWEQALFAIPGVKGSGLEVSAYPAMVQLHLDGFDLQSEVIPILKRDLARAQEQGRANRLSWTTIAKRVREAREDASRVRTNGSHSPASETIEAPWEQRLAAARERKQWPAKWGPYPNQPGCLAPTSLVHPDDGKGWTDWKVAS